ncbi:MAG: TIGR01777 family oxidoreductase [Gemmatimonadota bacterium]
MQKVLISGSSGLIGTALSTALTTQGERVSTLVRPGSRGAHEPGAVRWDPGRDRVDAAALEGFDAVVHLAGENLVSGRWTDDKKRRIVNSRVGGTQLLSSALATTGARPRVLISASAVGFYGNRGDEWLDESSPPGTGFLADLCTRWEAAATPAEEAGIRVVNVRFGVVLASSGGALRRMLTPFRLGLGGSLGGGRQFMSWITLEDAVRTVLRAMEDEHLVGPVNAVAPTPVRNVAFTRSLGRVIRRPTLAAVPAAALRLALGPMADELLLASQRVRPARLQSAGFKFSHPELESALRSVVGSD